MVIIMNRKAMDTIKSYINTKNKVVDFAVFGYKYQYEFAINWLNNKLNINFVL